jgi:ribokinase
VLLTQLELPLPTVAAALRRAREAGAMTVLNAAPYDAAILDSLPFVDLLVLNEVEGADLLGWERVTTETAPEAVGAILALGVGAVALTLGPRGATLGRGDERRHLPAPTVTVVDTTAAGDAFTGALAAGLAAGDDLFIAAARAIRVGSLTVTKAGAQPSLPYLREVEDRSR